MPVYGSALTLAGGWLAAWLAAELALGLGDAATPQAAKTITAPAVKASRGDHLEVRDMR
jgi:hypothetical protein